MRQFQQFSPRLKARIAGALYLLAIVMGVAAMVLIDRRMQVQGDQANLLGAVLYTGVTVLLWDLLRPVNPWLSTVAAMFSLAGCWLPHSWYGAAHLSNYFFFGVYCLLVGYLIFRSEFLPKAVGVLMAIAGFCWLTTLWPVMQPISPYTMVVGLIGEGTLMAYLLIKGLDERRWREQARLVRGD